MRKSRSLFTDAKPCRTGALVYPMLLILLLAVIVALNFVNNGRVKLLNEDVTITSLSKDLEKFRILHISDLHGNEYGANQSTISTMLKTADTFPAASAMQSEERAPRGLTAEALRPARSSSRWPIAALMASFRASTSAWASSTMACISRSSLTFCSSSWVLMCVPPVLVWVAWNGKRRVALCWNLALWLPPQLRFRSCLAAFSFDLGFPS